MKTATIPSLRVDPALREAAEDVLAEGETLSSFVETSLRAQIERRKAPAAFVARGLDSRVQAEATGRYVPSETVVAVLEAKLLQVKRGAP